MCDSDSDSSFQGFSPVTSEDELKTDSEEMSDNLSSDEENMTSEGNSGICLF